MWQKQTLQRRDSVQLSRWLWEFGQPDNPLVSQDILILSHTHTYTHFLVSLGKLQHGKDYLDTNISKRALKKSMISKAASPTHYYVMKSI